MDANDYTSIADLYDAFVRVELDLEFWRGEVRRADGPVLELMAGTGRVSAAIAPLCTHLTCVDLSLALLQRIPAKLPDGGPRPRLVCADVRYLPLTLSAALAIVPFNSFAELVREEDRAAALREIRRLVRADGRFICTIHNPAVRVTSLDGKPRSLGSFALRDGATTVEVTSEGRLDGESRIAESRQTFVFVDGDRRQSNERSHVVRFALLEPATLHAAARTAGFDIVEEFGDYDRSPFDPKASPFLIAVYR